VWGLLVSFCPECGVYIYAYLLSVGFIYICMFAECGVSGVFLSLKNWARHTCVLVALLK